MSYIAIKKAIEKDNDLSRLYSQLEKLHAKGYPAERNHELSQLRADFEINRNNLLREFLKKEIKFLETYGYKENS